MSTTRFEPAEYPIPVTVVTGHHDRIEALHEWMKFEPVGAAIAGNLVAWTSLDKAIAYNEQRAEESDNVLIRQFCTDLAQELKAITNDNRYTYSTELALLWGKAYPKQALQARMRQGLNICEAHHGRV